MLSNSGGVAQTFDLLNRMTTYTDGTNTAAYAYNPDNMRSSKTVNGTTTTHVWIGSNIALDITGQNTVSYVGNIKSNYGWYVYNANGDVVQLTDGSGNVTKYYDYDPYGNQLQDADPTDGNPYRYSGQYFDAESGYIYLRARYYDPATGRFISEDPAFDGFNWYAYCANNPLTYHDPSGMFFKAIGNWLSNRVNEWREGISIMHSSGGGKSAFASYCEGTMNATGSLLNAATSPIKTMERAAISFQQDPRRNNPIYGAYSFLENLARSSYNGDWNSVAYSLGGATVNLGTFAGGAHIAGSIAPNGFTATLNTGSRTFAYAGGGTSVTTTTVTVSVGGTQVVATGAFAGGGISYMAGSGGGGRGPTWDTSSNRTVQQSLQGQGQLRNLRNNPNLKGVNIEDLLNKTPAELEAMVRANQLPQSTLTQIRKAFQGRDLGRGH